jgi:hypothetical protein
VRGNAAIPNGNVDQGTWSNIGCVAGATLERGNALVESLKINVISEEVRRKRPVVVKRRTGKSEQITEMANLYFNSCALPIRFWSKGSRPPFARPKAVCPR